MGRGRGKGGDDNEMAYGCGGCICAIGLLLTVILLPLSFSKVEFFEAGLKMQKSTGKVDRDEVYDAGNYCIGPDYSFKKYPISIQLFNQRVSVYTKSSQTDAGATINLDISFIYKLRKADIGKLYAKVSHSFEPLIVSYALDAIKNTAPNFAVDDYLLKRTEIEKAMFDSVSKSLKDDMYTDVLDLQLRRILLSTDYESTKLEAATTIIKAGTQLFVQESTLVKERTSLNVLKIQNSALALANQANAQATVIKEKATYEAKQLVEQRRSEGLKLMLSECALITDEHKASLDYITTLINNKARITPYMNVGGLLEKIIT